MVLHHNRALFQEAVVTTAKQLGMRDIYVEKDYWVTVALHAVFHSSLAGEAVFKGGTALSKCFQLIERFSEDIDLVVLHREGESDNQLKNKIRGLSKVVTGVIPEIEVPGLTNKRGNIRKTVHQYDKVYGGDFGQVREQLVVEATWLGNHEPFFRMEVASYIANMMEAAGQQGLVKEYGLEPFMIQVLSPRRTFCEKIMSLVRFSWSEQPIRDLRNKIRHVYDLHQMLQDQGLEAFFSCPDFEAMLQKVGADDKIGYKNNNTWLDHHPASALLFAKPTETWEQLRTEYGGNFKQLVTGVLPAEDVVLKTLTRVANRLAEVSW